MTVPLRRIISLSAVLLVIPLLLLSCGKKGPPSLKAFEKPQAPAALSLAHREDMLILSWAYPDNLRQGIKGFHILRSENGSFERVAFIGSDGSSYADGDFRLNVAYKYKIIAASRKDVLSDASPVIAVTAVALPAPPVNIKAAVKQEAVELSWSVSGEGACYNVYKSAKKDVFEGAAQKNGRINAGVGVGH